MSEYPWNEKNNTFTWLNSLHNPFKDFAIFWISQKQSVSEVLKKRCSFLPADVNILKDFLVLEELAKMLG